MAREGERCQVSLRDRDAELLVKLTDERVLGRLSRLDLAARELPEARKRAAFRPLGKQHPPFPVEENAGRHEDDRPLAPRAHLGSPARREIGLMSGNRR